MITSNIKDYFLTLFFFLILFCLRPAICNKQAKLLTLTHFFSITDIYRNILEMALKSFKKKSYGKFACTSYRKVTISFFSFKY